MKVSVVIVSYNVYPFLDNCLKSVRQSLMGIDGEVLVVDNASVDRTPQLLREHFPDVNCILNAENRGFAKANNQALSIARGEYVLLLNPDTIVSENTISTCIDFMDAHPEAGAAGVRMLDGSGRFLPESKRGLPTLLSSFMKMSGMYRLFPGSALFNRYYQGHIGEKQTAKIEVLTGAFMFIRRKVLDQTGLLDEDFFMYGEDIDLSYRITSSGHAIYYLPTTEIVHYKGESTRRASLNYLLTFYQAMLIFTQKHPELRGQQFLIRVAIYLHGLARFVKQCITRMWPVLLDAIMLYGSFYCISIGWTRYYFHNPDYFRDSFYYFNLPLYTAIGVLTMFLSGAYDLPTERKRSWIGFLNGTVAILVIYAFLPLQFRTSRTVIVLGSALFAAALWLTRASLRPWRTTDTFTGPGSNRKAIIVGGMAEADRIKELINRSRDQIDIVGTVSPDASPGVGDKETLGPISKLEEIIRVHQIREVIFSAQDVPFSVFTGTISSLGPGIRYMLAASTTMNIVGSMNRDTEGESYGLRIDFNLSHPSSRRSKRILDLLVAAGALLLIPFIFFTVKSPARLFSNCVAVLIGSKTWVSYHPAHPTRHVLPAVRNGVLAPAYPDSNEDPGRRLEHIHYVYARDYHWTTDIQILFSQWKRVGQNPVKNEC